MSKRESNVPLQADAYPPTDIETSNSLAHLAALIRSEHEAVATALRRVSGTLLRLVNCS
jgi:hypothetical protein